jgi:protoheme IX farnesyltransferase
MLPASSVRAADYWTLTKPEVNLLIGVTTAAGFSLAGAGHGQGASISGLVHTVVGTLLVASGTGTLNQLLERRFDALMRRTASRPVAAGRIAPWHALVFGVVLATVGTIELAVAVNRLSSVLALATMASYLLVYTPLKRKTPLCTLIGAVPGAAPPLIGWAGATGALSVEAWILYSMVFLWQFPHFMAIVWMYREDYRRAGYRVVPRDKPMVPFVLCQVMIPLLVLVPLSLTPVFFGRAGLVYLATALVLGAGFIYRADQLAVHQSNAMARRLLLTSIVYLPLIFIALVLDRA